MPPHIPLTAHATLPGDDARFIEIRSRLDDANPRRCGHIITVLPKPWSLTGTSTTDKKAYFSQSSTILCRERSREASTAGD